MFGTVLGALAVGYARRAIAEMFGTALGVLAVLAGYTAQNVTIVYWTDSSVNAFGILLLCGSAFGAFFGLCLLAFALVFRDSDALAVSDDAAECRLFVWPFCRGGSAGGGSSSTP